MKANSKKKTFPAYFGCLAAILALVIVIVGPMTKGFADRTFATEIIVILMIGIIAELITFFTNSKLMPLVTAVIFAVGLGFIFMHAAPIVADHYNDLNFRNGDYRSVCLYLAVGCLMGISSVIACFGDTKEVES